MLLYMKKMKMLDKNSVCHWGRQEVGFWLTHGLCVCPTIFLYFWL
jgi:hypothetical protein